MLKAIRSGVVIAFAVAGLAIASGASATLFSFPGNQCVSGDGDISYPGGSAFATASSVFYCGILRQSPDAANITNINVGVTDQNNAGSISCFVRSCGPLGTGCANSATDSTTNAFTGTDTLSLGSVSGFANGAAFVQCSMPGVGAGQSSIASYRWDD